MEISSVVGRACLPVVAGVALMCPRERVCSPLRRLVYAWNGMMSEDYGGIDDKTGIEDGFQLDFRPGK